MARVPSRFVVFASVPACTRPSTGPSSTPSIISTSTSGIRVSPKTRLARKATTSRPPTNPRINAADIPAPSSVKQHRLQLGKGRDSRFLRVLCGIPLRPLRLKLLISQLSVCSRGLTPDVAKSRPDRTSYRVLLSSSGQNIEGEKLALSLRRTTCARWLQPGGGVVLGHQRLQRRIRLPALRFLSGDRAFARRRLRSDAHARACDHVPIFLRSRANSGRRCRARLGGLALLIFYRALSQGMGLTAPVAAVLGAAIPAAFTMITHGLPGKLGLAGFLLAGIGIWLISRPDGSAQLRRRFHGRPGRSRLRRILHLHQSHRRQLSAMVGGVFPRRLFAAGGRHRFVPPGQGPSAARPTPPSRSSPDVSTSPARPSSSAPIRPGGWIRWWCCRRFIRLTVLLARFFLKEQFTRWKTVGIFAALRPCR